MPSKKISINEDIFKHFSEFEAAADDLKNKENPLKLQLMKKNSCQEIFFPLQVLI